MQQHIAAAPVDFKGNDFFCRRMKKEKAFLFLFLSFFRLLCIPLRGEMMGRKGFYSGRQGSGGGGCCLSV
jgi:hypothetical protein